MKGTEFRIGDRVVLYGATEHRRGEVVGIMRGCMSDGDDEVIFSKVWVRYDGCEKLEFAPASLLVREKKRRATKKKGRAK